jgi:hypothetical protein
MEDVVIIGAGPAGLAAAAACRARDLSYRIVEAGATVLERDHAEHAALPRGVGGAGLFSDGKFSFYPSATRLWQLQPQAHLKLAYAWVSETLRDLALLPETSG